MLDDLFGASAKTSIKGDLGDFALEAATGSAGLGVLKSGARRLLRKGEKDPSIDTLKKLVSGLDK